MSLTFPKRFVSSYVETQFIGLIFKKIHRSKKRICVVRLETSVFTVCSDKLPEIPCVGSNGADSQADLHLSLISKFSFYIDP